jgi:hypothetical protein
MGQFIVALLIGGFFSFIILALQHCFEVAETVKEIVVEVEPNYTFEVNLPYSANAFRDPENQPWLFTDGIIVSVINYFRNELKHYNGDFTKDESIELSHILYEKTHVIERFIRQSKRGKYDDQLYRQLIDVRFADSHDEKTFLLESVFKEAHNTLIDDLFAGKLKC